MKKHFGVFIMALVMASLSGCEEQYTEEELHQMCVDTYMEGNIPDLSFEVKDSYETIEDTYLEIVRLAIWAEEKRYEIDDIFYEDNYRFDDAVNEIVSWRNLSWFDVEDRFKEEKYKYKKMLQCNRDEYLVQILNVSCEELQNNREEICVELDESGLDYISRAEKERIGKDYKWMFITICNEKIPQEVFHKLYPKEMYQGAMECIYHPITKDSLKKTKEYLILIGDYEKYAANIEKGNILVHEAERCDYGDCQMSGDKESKFYDGEYCRFHADYLDTGGKKKNKTSPSGNGWSGGGLDLGEATDSYDKEDKDMGNTSKKEKPYDPYDVYDYYDPEDFYYDWEDDFDGYEDAEDYWYEAWDE